VADPLQLSVRHADPMLGAATELRLALPSDVDLVGPAVELISAHCCTGVLSRRRVLFNLRTALAEALTNAIVYGNRADPAKQVRVRVELGLRVVHIHVEDDGDGCDAATGPAPTTPDRLLSTTAGAVRHPPPRGRGALQRARDTCLTLKAG
jgi:serine/threonine-protein kinase RsbW